MADRFDGTIQLGGEVTESQYQALMKLCDDLDLEEQVDGFYFRSCAPGDFRTLVDHCNKERIALSITWDAKWEYGSYVEYFINGSYSTFGCNADGEIVVPLAQLREHKFMFVKDFIDSLNIPNFPILTVHRDDGEEDQFHDFDSRTAAVSYRDAHRKGWEVKPVEVSDGNYIYRVQPNQS